MHGGNNFNSVNNDNELGKELKRIDKGLIVL